VSGAEDRGAAAGAGRRADLVALLAPALLAPLAPLVARAAGGPFLLPVLATAAIHPFLARLVLRGRRAAAAAAALLWAAALSATLIAASARDPAAMAPVVAGGEAYREEMFAFLETGAGREADAARFLPQHALHLVLFCALTVVSGGLLGLALGAVLVGYMSFYVGALAAAGGAPILAYLCGWPPWAVLRVVAFVLLGVVLSDPLLRAAARRAGRVPPPTAGARRMVLAAAALLVADALLKALLAPSWAALLRRCLPSP
jgi:hypothetical protein